jgi:energy-converting hydrogenase Eha subunit E
MLTVGIVLLIVGAIVALMGAGAFGLAGDPAVRPLGLGVAVVGVILIVIAVLPAGVH